MKDSPIPTLKLSATATNLPLQVSREGQRGLRFNHKVYGWTSTTINIEKKPDVADIRTRAVDSSCLSDIPSIYGI